MEAHRQRADWWKREQARAPEEQTEDEPLMPEHICESRKLEGPGNRAFSTYGSPCRDVPGGVTSRAETSTQLPIQLLACYRKATILPTGGHTWIDA